LTLNAFIKFHMALKANILNQIENLSTWPSIVVRLRICHYHKISSCGVDAVGTREFEIFVVYLLERPHSEDEPIRGIQLRDCYYSVDATNQIDHGVCLDSGHCPSELRSREKRQARVDDIGVQNVDRLVDLLITSVLCAHCSRHSLEDPGKL
ncbi:hypothetical protein, partial [Pelagicoccus sp. SDUM812002]|uniref:hypothetical protein n=1 Tax=Pelagicoccus sp. SDUM812002 TaxID=3041266 RepID=UPI0028106EA8